MLPGPAAADASVTSTVAATASVLPALVTANVSEHVSSGQRRLADTLAELRGDGASHTACVDTLFAGLQPAEDTLQPTAGDDSAVIPEVPAVVVSGVVVGPKGAVATIDGEPQRVGAVLGRWTIEEISRTGVILVSGPHRAELVVDMPSLD